MLTVNISETQEKLRDDRIEYPNIVGSLRYYIGQFLDYLADRLSHLKGNEISTEEFLLEVELAFMDLKTGINFPTGQIITHPAADRVPTVELLIRMVLPKVYAVIFSPEFTQELHNVTTEVKEEVAALKNVP